MFNDSDHPWSIWANVYRSQLDVKSWTFECWCHELFAFIEPVKQLNTGDQLTNVWFSYCWCHCQFSASASQGMMAVCSICLGIPCNELREFPNDQRVLASHYMPISKLQCCLVDTCLHTVLYITVYIRPDVCVKMFSTRRLAATRPCSSRCSSFKYVYRPLLGCIEWDIFGHFALSHWLVC